MIRNPNTRRMLSVVLMVLGGLLLFLAPADAWIGWLLLVLGAVLETAGRLMQRQGGR